MIIIIPEKRRLLEILAVLITGLGKFVFMDWLNLKFLFISVICLGWGFYIYQRAKEQDGILAHWGLSKGGLEKTFLELLPLALLIIAAFIFIGFELGTTVLHWNIIPILLVYPLWGIIQQFIMIGILAKNMKESKELNFSDHAIILVTAVVFALVHYPFGILMIGTFFLALCYTYLYLHNRNLIAMGIYHGWIGAFFFYTIMGRDQWQEVFGLLGG